MSLADLAPELLTQIFSSLHSVHDVLNLNQTCKRFHYLLRSSQRLPTLFAAAEREFGPLKDIVRLVTWNRMQCTWNFTETRTVTSTQNLELLKQILKVGRTARKIEMLYPAYKWGERRYLERRSLTAEEACRLRRAIYRYWLFCEAFQNKTCTRGSRRLQGIIEERSKLLRGWGSDELFEIEDARLVLEDIISNDLCPSDGTVQRWFSENCDFSDVRWQSRHTVYPLHHKQSFLQIINGHSWPPDRYTSQPQVQFLHDSLFHSHREDERSRERSNLPVPQRRKSEMRGWGDDISQYYIVQSMLKLNPDQVLHLYENITTREGIEWYIENELGGEWFWDNGQTWSDTYSLVLLRRGWDLESVEIAIEDGSAGLIGKPLEEISLALAGQLIYMTEQEDGDQESELTCL